MSDWSGGEREGERESRLADFDSCHRPEHFCVVLLTLLSRVFPLHAPLSLSRPRVAEPGNFPQHPCGEPRARGTLPPRIF